jgi:hypothetical protein
VVLVRRRDHSWWTGTSTTLNIVVIPREGEESSRIVIPRKRGESRGCEFLSQRLFGDRFNRLLDHLE